MIKRQEPGKKTLAITMGDPGGIGPEIILRAVTSPVVRKYCNPVIIGDASVMQQAVTLLKLSQKISPAGISDARPLPGIIHMIDMGKTEKFSKGRPTSAGGAACAGYIREAVRLALEKRVDGIITAPISKEALKMAGLPWPGHTEMLAELTKTKDYAMMLVGGPLRVILVTIHTALKYVPELITKQRVLKTIRLAQKACAMLQIKKNRIAVAGLNPHAGEAGIFGDEERKIIAPAIQAAIREGIPVSGPYPPDTIFNKAYNGEMDILVCMYHDQGLIPLKMIAFDTGVNVTVGLPFIRTSPDHGTAYDIAWKGIANPSSMIEAIKVASTLKI
jgi:4-hydroxythreonine-4-phosphate dehydrogenase